jgi:hypothetical protein
VDGLTALSRYEYGLRPRMSWSFIGENPDASDRLR